MLMVHRAEVIGMWINEYNEEEMMIFQKLQMIRHFGTACIHSLA